MRTNLFSRLLATLVAASCALTAHAQAPYLVTDLNAGSASSQSSPIGAAGDRLIFRGTDGANSGLLRFPGLGTATDHIRVRAKDCGPSCGADDTYRLRMYETTLRAPRVNTTGTHSTALVLQNTTGAPVQAVAAFWSDGGSLAGLQQANVAPHGTTIVDLGTVAPPFAGSLTVGHDAPYGALVGKVVSADPSTGAAPRINNQGGQVTAVILQNATTSPAAGVLTGWHAGGAFGFRSAVVTIPPRGTAVVDTTQEFAGFVGSLTVAHTAPYGALVGKVVALDPSTGLSFETPLTPKPR